MSDVLISEEVKPQLRIYSSEWGIWGKEKTNYADDDRQHKHEREIALLDQLMNIAPDRVKLALKYTYGLCNLDGYAQPISFEEFNELLLLHNNAENYVRDFESPGFKYLIRELFYIQQAGANIDGFRDGDLVNETQNPVVWRKYIYLDFFKFSCVNVLMRESFQDIEIASSDCLLGKIILSYFLGVGSFIEKSFLLFPEDKVSELEAKIQELCLRLEMYTEYPDLELEGLESDFSQLDSFVKVNRKTCAALDLENALHAKRFEVLHECNRYYSGYINASCVETFRADGMVSQQAKDPLKAVIKLFGSLSDVNDVMAVKSTLREYRLLAEGRYRPEQDFPCVYTAKNFVAKTNHPWFQFLLYECKILGYLFEREFPATGKNARIVFEDLAPFYAASFNKNKLFDFQIAISPGLPKLVLAHHIHNANCNTTYRKMVINKLILWDSSKVVFNLSSSSSKPEIVRRERQNCLSLGYNHYRLHGRQHLKAGNQNRAIFNAIERDGHEYYLTMDDDFFAFPDFAIIGAKHIAGRKLDYFQALNYYSGIYEVCSLAEKADAEVMHNFEITFGYTTPKLFTFPRGTSTIFSFINGKNSLTDTGGFLIDFSCEDFGQGCVSLIQQNSSILGRAAHVFEPGDVSPYVHCIGEGVDLNGKIKQIERWSHGSAKVLFFLMLPVLVKSFLRRDYGLLMNKQFVGTLLIYCSSIFFRITTLLLICSPLLLGHLIEVVDSHLNQDFVYVRLLVVVMCLNFMMFTLKNFNLQQRISFSPVRIFLLDLIINLAALKGFAKGMLGVTPRSWSTNKTRSYHAELYMGTHVLVVLLFFGLMSNSLFGSLIHFFWPIFILMALLSGLFFLNKRSTPLNYHVQVSAKKMRHAWVAVVVLNGIFSGFLFFLELSTHPDFYKLSLLLFLMSISIHSIFTEVVYLRVLKFQRKLTLDLS